MAGRTSTGSRKLQARILAALAMLVVVYAGFGWMVIDYGVPVRWVGLGAAAVLVAQWLPCERLALAVAKARLVDQRQARRLHASLDRLCALTGQPRPRVAVTRDQAPNAFTVGRSRRRTTIIVTRGLLRLDPPELEAALAHELAHIEHRDVAVMTLASSFAVALAWLLRGPYGVLVRLNETESDALGRVAGWARVAVQDRGPFGFTCGPLGNTEMGYLATNPRYSAFLLRLNPLVSVPFMFVILGVGVVAVAIWIAIVTLWGPVLAGSTLAMYLPLRALSRGRELAADRTAALWLGRPALLAATLVKVAGQGDQIPRTDLRASGLALLGLVAGRGELPGWLARHPPLHRRLAQLDQLTRLLH